MWTPLVMCPMGISSSAAPRPEVRPHPPRDVAVEVAHGVGPAGKLQRQDGHAERLVLVLRLDPAQAHQLLEGDAQLVAQRAKVLLDQRAVEAVVSGGDGRVRGEDGAMGDLPQRRLEAHPVFFHPHADGLERGEGAVPFVEVKNARGNPQGGQRADPAHPGHQFLADPRAVVAAVEPGGQFAVLGAVAGHVAVQQIQLHPPHAHQPHLRQQPARARLDLHGDRLAGAVAGGLHGEVFHLRVQVLFLLVAVDVQVLLEIALVVEQADGHQRHAQGAGALDVVAGEDPQAAGIDRHGFVDAEFEGKIGDRPRAEHAGVRPSPGRHLGSVFLQPPIRLVDAAEQDQFRRPQIEAFGSEFRQQRDRIVVQLPPADGVEVAEEVNHFRVPTPPEVPGQGDALLVQGFRRNSVWRNGFTHDVRNRFGMAHSGPTLRKQKICIASMSLYRPSWVESTPLPPVACTVPLSLRGDGRGEGIDREDAESGGRASA